MVQTDLVFLTKMNALPPVTDCRISLSELLPANRKYCPSHTVPLAAAFVKCYTDYQTRV